MATSSGGQSYVIGGVKIKFPVKAYPSQLSMMAKIIKGLDNKENALLESPTGSGKSLALLCGALAWQQKYAETLEAEEAEKKKKPPVVCTCSCAERPEVPELTADTLPDFDDGFNDDDDFQDDGSSPYRHMTRPSSLVAKFQNLSGRDKVNPTPSSGKPHSSPRSCDCQCHCSSTKAQEARAKLKIPRIYFGTRTHKQIAQITKELGRTEYRHTRMTILASRDHTCIDAEVSKSSNKNEDCKLKIDGPGCRWLDRAKSMTHRSMADSPLASSWALEEFVDYCKGRKACPYYATRSLKDSADIVFCPYNYLIDPSIRQSMDISLKDHILILDEAHNIEDSCRTAASAVFNQKELNDAEINIANMIQANINPGDMFILKTVCRKFVDFLQDQGEALDPESAKFDQPSKCWQGMDSLAVLKQLGVGPDRFEEFKRAFGAVAEEQQQRLDDNKQVTHILLTPTFHILGTLLIVLTFIYRHDMMYLNDYRLVLARRVVYLSGEDDDDQWKSKRKRAKKQMTFTYDLNFWCMNPAVSFTEISSVLRSCIVTSGTLSPLTSFQSELGTTFPIKLEASHVITKSQVWVGSISHGPNGTPLLGTYQSTQTFQYQDDLGRLLLRICKTMPNGVLCFFPSYALMSKLTDRWKETGMWNDLSRSKLVLTEPRRGKKKDFDDLMTEFYQVIRDTQHNTGGITGALFLAVSRGKVSEGLDFADNNARAVVTIGIPFPSIKDEQVELKKKYNTTHFAERGLLNGNEWYEIQAYRALNQALGRCIRHKNDWGAIILVDERFSKNPTRYTRGLSKWVRGRVEFYPNFAQAEDSLETFTESMIANPPCNRLVSNEETPNQTIVVPTDTTLNTTFQPTQLPPQNNPPRISPPKPQTMLPPDAMNVAPPHQKSGPPMLPPLDANHVEVQAHSSSNNTGASNFDAPKPSSFTENMFESSSGDQSYTLPSQAGGFLAGNSFQQTPEHPGIGRGRGRGRGRGQIVVGGVASQQDMFRPITRQDAVGSSMQVTNEQPRTFAPRTMMPTQFRASSSTMASDWTRSVPPLRPQTAAPGEARQMASLLKMQNSLNNGLNTPQMQTNHCAERGQNKVTPPWKCDVTLDDDLDLTFNPTSHSTQINERPKMPMNAAGPQNASLNATERCAQLSQAQLNMKSVRKPDLSRLPKSMMRSGNQSALNRTSSPSKLQHNHTTTCENVETGVCCKQNTNVYKFVSLDGGKPTSPTPNPTPKPASSPAASPTSSPLLFDSEPSLNDQENLGHHVEEEDDVYSLMGNDHVGADVDDMVVTKHVETPTLKRRVGNRNNVRLAKKRKIQSSDQNDLNSNFKNRGTDFEVFLCSACRSELSIHVSAPQPCDKFIARLLAVEHDLLFYKCRKSEVTRSALSAVTHSVDDGGMLNAYYNAQTQVCVQLVQCSKCQTANKRSPIIGAEIVISKTKPQDTGQVWLVSSRICTSYDRT